MIKTPEKDPSRMNPTKKLVFHELFTEFEDLYKTVPQGDMSQYTRTVLLTPSEAQPLLTTIHYVFHAGRDEYFGEIMKALTHSPENPPYGNKPKIILDAHPDQPTESLCIHIPSPTDELIGIRVLLERTRNPENTGLVQVITNNGDWIKRTDMERNKDWEISALYLAIYDISHRRATASTVSQNT